MNVTDVDLCIAINVIRLVTYLTRIRGLIQLNETTHMWRSRYIRRQALTLEGIGDVGSVRMQVVDSWAENKQDTGPRIQSSRRFNPNRSGVAYGT